MKIRRHIPGFVDVDPPEDIEFRSIEELLAIEWLKNDRENDFDGIPFWRHSQSRYGDEWLLLSEWKGNGVHKWWVVGYLSDDMGLPEFKAKEKP